MDITNTIQISDASQLPSVIKWKKWQEEFLEGIEKKKMKNPNLLDNEMRNYISNARYQVYNVFRTPPTASIMSEYVGYTIRFFADLEQSIFKRRVDLKDYYHSMSELLAMYCDLRVYALFQHTGHLDEIRHQFLHMLRQFLANDCDYITNALLRIQRLKCSRLLFENIFKFVEQNANFERTHTSCVSYCRYILFYRQWKKMYTDILVLREISGRASERLKPPPNFRKHKLFEILRPKTGTVPPNLTLFFLTAAINTNMVVDKFFTIDIYEPETSTPDDLIEVVDLTDEIDSPKQEDQSLEQQSQPQVNRTSNKSNDDTYNLRLSFNNMMNMDKQVCNQQTTVSQSTSSQCTSLSSYSHQPFWSPITRNLLSNTNKDHQESLDAGIFSDRSSGNSPAYEMEMKDMNVITPTPPLSVSEKVITRVISNSCCKCGHKSSSSIVLPSSSSSSQQITTIETSIPSLSQSKNADIVILDVEDVEQNDKELTQVVLESQLNCSKIDGLVPGDNDVIIVNDYDNNEKSRIINIEEITPPSSRQTENSDTSPTPSELAQNVNVNIRKSNLKDVGVSTEDIMDSIDEQALSDSGDTLRNSDSANKIRVMRVVDVTLNTCIGNDGISKLQQASTSTNQDADVLRDAETLTMDHTQGMMKSQSICSQIQTLVPGKESKIKKIEKLLPLSGQIEKSTTSLTPSELTQNVSNVINNLTKESDNRTMNIKKSNLKDVSVSTQNILSPTHEHVLNDSGDQLKKSPNKVRVMSVVDITPNTCVGANGISKLQQSSSSTNIITDVFHDAETFTIDKSTHKEIENSTMVDIDNNNDEENINTDMDTQHFVDQMFCSKPFKSISNEKNNKKQNIDRNTDISNDNDNVNSDKSHCELPSYLKSPPQSDAFFYGFSNNNNSGSGLLKSLSSNNNSLSSSAPLLNINNSNTDHSQCSIHLQNATRLTEEFVSSRTRDQKISKHTENFNKNTTSIKNNITKSILKTSRKTHSANNNENNTSSKKKSVVLSNDSYTRYIHEDENQPIMKSGHGSNHRKQHSGVSSSSLMQMFGQSKKQGSIIIAENHYDKPEEHIRRHSRHQDYYEYRLNSPYQHQQERRVLRLRSESRELNCIESDTPSYRDPYGRYRQTNCQEFWNQPKDRENGRYIPRRRCRSNSESRAQSYYSSTKESSAKRARFEGFNENSARETRSRNIEGNRSFEDKTSNKITQNIQGQINPRNRVTRSKNIDGNRSFEDKTSNKITQNIRGQGNARNRTKISSDEEKQLLYEKLRRKYNILIEVQIILNESNNLSLELYQKKLAEGKSANSRNNHKTSKIQRIFVERNQRKKSESVNIERDSKELPNPPSNDDRKSRLRNRRNSNVNDTSIGQRRGRSRTSMKSDSSAINIHSAEKSNSNDRSSPTNTEPINNDNLIMSTESMYSSTKYFSTPVRLPEFVECLQASTPATSITSKSDEIHVPSIQSCIERLQNSLASPISLSATAPEDITDSILNDNNLNNKKFNSIKSGNLVKSNVTKRKLVNIFSDDSDSVQDDNVEYDHEKLQNDNNNEQYEEYQEQNLDVLSADANVDLTVLSTKGAKKLLKDEVNRQIRQSRRSSSTNNRIFSTDTSSTRRLRKAEYLKSFRHVTGDIEEEQSTNDDDVSTSTLTTDATTTKNIVSSTPLPATSVSKLSWEHYINLSPEKQQVSIVDNNVDDDDESNPIYDELSTIVKSSDIEKPNDQLKINSVGEHDELSISIDQEKSYLKDKNEMSYPATPMMNISVLELPSNSESPIVSGGAELEQPIKNSNQLKLSNHHLDIISENDTIHNSEQLESNKIHTDIFVNSPESISITNNMECITTPIISPILLNNDSEKKSKSSRKVTFFEKTDNIGDGLNAKSNDQQVKKINKKNRKTINNLSCKLNNKIINDDEVVNKVIELKNKTINDVKPNKPVNNSKKRQIKQQTTSNNVKNNKSIKHELPLNVKKRRLLNFTTPPTMSITCNSVLENSTVVSDDDEDDNISLAELKRRNSVLIKKKLKNVDSKLNNRGIKSQKNCDINNVSSTSTKTNDISTSTGAIVLTLDEIETCDISVVSCEEVVGEGTILLNLHTSLHKSSANTDNKPTTTNNSKVNHVNGT